VKAPVAALKPAPPAQAAQVIAQAPPAEPDGPVDFSDGFVVGSGKAYAGGVTTSGGTSEKAVHAERVDPKAPPADDYSAPVSLSAEHWQCPWPREADAADINEQSVVLRVDVDAGGAVRSVKVLADPGFGFGAAAAVCAERTRFEAARDRAGRNVGGLSPPIRVRFTR
jgi:protein TonB